MKSWNLFLSCHSGESQNPVTKNYTKAIVNGWIPDEEYLKAKALRYSSSGMTGDELLMTTRDPRFRGDDIERGDDRELGNRTEMFVIIR